MFQAFLVCLYAGKCQIAVGTLNGRDNCLDQPHHYRRKEIVEPDRPVPAEKGEVFELTEVVDEDGSVRRVTPEAGSTENGLPGPQSPPIRRL